MFRRRSFPTINDREVHTRGIIYMNRWFVRKLDGMSVGNADCSLKNVNIIRPQIGKIYLEC